MKRPMLRPTFKLAFALALALASGSAAALGLGQIEVKSRAGQPLVAEIPIVSSDPSELEQLQARLASPETFSRIGLQPPQGIVSDLQFMVGLDNAGNPIIRVTSSQPVTQPLLTFLIEVDWGQGRLVREYSALVDTPQTVQAPLQPPIEAPMVEAPNVIQRPVEPVATAPEDQPAAEPVADAPAQPSQPTPTRPQPVATAPAAVPAPSLTGDAYSVQRGDTLSEIASRVASDGASLDQTMIALLRANPDAFISGNINQLKAGVVLRVPAGEDLASVSAVQASQLVHSQMAQWRESRRAVPQPELADATALASSSSNQATSNAAQRRADARLEIVPPGASEATKAGIQSGIDAGGEGDMLLQQQATETLAAREAELQEMKSRVAELEKLQNQQQQLIAMKDSELAAAQQRLAENQAQAQTATAMPWVIGGLGAIALGLLAWWIARRRPAKPVFKAPGAPSIADSFGSAPVDVVRAPKVADQMPLWDAREPERSAAQARSKKGSWHAPETDEVASAAPQTAGQERLELARAYLDLGDHASARQLLGELVINGDLAAKQQAARMLRELE